MELELLRALIFDCQHLFLAKFLRRLPPCENFAAKCLASGEQRADSYD